MKRSPFLPPLLPLVIILLSNIHAVGQTWVKLNNKAAYVALCSNATVLAWTGSPVVTSTTFGSTGTPGTVNANLGWLYYSPDLGAHWYRPTGGANNWAGVACSADGSRVIAAIRFGPVVTSADYSVTWRTNSLSSFGWRAVASSSDGATLLAAG